MGLAASQARLLTITSRLSSVELKQQRIAMDKMRLANDQEGVSEKYTNALSNKTLSISNGSEEIAMNYSTLAAQGYSVVRASDGLTPSSGVYSGNVVAKPTCPRPEEIEKPAILEQTQATTGTTGVSGATNATTETMGIFDYVYDAISKVSSINYWKTDSGKSVDTAGMTTAEKKAAGVTTTDYWESIKQKKALWTSSVIPAFDNAIAQLNKAGKTELAKNLATRKANTTQYINEERSTPKSTYDSGMNTYKAINRHCTVCTNAMFSSKDSYNAVTITVTKEGTASNTNSNTSTGWTAEQQTAYDNWLKEVVQAQAEWTAYDNYVSAVNSASGASAEQIEFYNQLKNSQFLIQGLLSGYLALTKDGSQVSLSSATDIVESYDKTDDAATEAEYNTQMNKINRKEKILDMQAKRLDTEYSALTNEYNSIKTIIDNHTQKDFSYFS